MPELGFQDHNQFILMTSGFRGARDASPDSLIFSADSNLSLFSSSASCSVERCSFASDVHDHDSLASQFSQHLAVHECGETTSSCGPDLDPNKATVHKTSPLCRKVEKAKVQKEDSVKTEDENQVLDLARSSFSQALKECQVQRSRSEAYLKKQDRRRPASVDLNNTYTNVTSSSPRFGVMKKSAVSTRRNGTFPSPGTPNYHHTGVGIQKGWSSERVPLHIGTNRRNVNNALLPFNNGRTLPSKWEDAERWIFSPVSGDGAMRPSFRQPQRRPKSKSGPLGPPGTAYYSMYSPAVHMFDGGNVGNVMAASPFTAGVIAANSLSIEYGGGHGGNGNFLARMEPCMGRSVSIHGCSEIVCQSFFPSSQDEKINSIEDEANDISRAVSRRDMATQMSPEGSPHLSPRGRLSLTASTPSALPIVELQSFHSSKQEVRDVEVDERVTMTRWSKKHRARNPGKGSGNFDDWRRKALEVRSTNWEVSEAAKNISKIKREEARITAWENLQNAKAEAAIRKLEMKLEKKRSSSMDKIMNKLRSAQRKAQQMRSSVVVNQAPRQVARTSHKVVSFRRTRQIGSLSGCFACHAF